MKEQAAEAPSNDKQVVSTGGSETILVAEDEEVLRKLAKEVLEGLGYRVILARDGQEALDVYRTNKDRIDLVALDMVMPRLSGLQAYQQMKELGGRSRFCSRPATVRRPTSLL
jgi:CheY-like chemotaxis protein